MQASASTGSPWRRSGPTSPSRKESQESPSLGGIMSEQIGRIESALATMRLELDREATDLKEQRAEVERQRASLEEERRVMALRVQRSEIVSVNVGGTHFQTLRSTLCRFPGSMIEAMFSRWELPMDDEGRAFIDRDPRFFACLLNFLRDPSAPIDLPGADDVVGLRREAEYFGLTPFLFSPVPLRVWRSYSSSMRVARRTAAGVGTPASRANRCGTSAASSPSTSTRSSASASAFPSGSRPSCCSPRRRIFVIGSAPPTLHRAAAALPRTGDNNGRLVVELGGDDGRLAFEPLELLERRRTRRA